MFKYMFLTVVLTLLSGSQTIFGCCSRGWVKGQAPIAPAAYAVSPGSLSQGTVTTGAELGSPLSAPVSSPYGQTFDSYERRLDDLKRKYAFIRSENPRDLAGLRRQDDALRVIQAQLTELPVVRDEDLGRIVADYRVVPGRTSKK